MANTRAGEMSHLACLVFGLVTTIDLVVIAGHAWAAWTAITSVIGNLYPVLRQRYTRARLARIGTGRRARATSGACT